MIIGIANNLYPPFGRDSGAEIIAQQMAMDLRQKGHEVFVISTKTPNSSRPQEKDLYWLNSRYELLANMNIIQKLTWYFIQLFFPPHQKALTKILQDKQVDLFITHNILGLSFALPKILHKQKIKHHHILHDIQLLHPSGLLYFGQEKKLDSGLAYLYQALTKKIFKHSQLIISPSQWLLNLHQKYNFFQQQKTVVRPNFELDLKTITKEKNKPVRFLFAGQLENHKGLNLLIAAWKDTKLNPTQASLSIAGKGRMLQQVTQASKELKNLQYLGHLNREQMESALKSHDCLVMPSTVYENSPTILWEASKHQLSAIASNLGGIPELEPHLDLKLFTPGNKKALSEALRHYALT